MGIASDIFGVGGLATSIASVIDKLLPDTAAKAAAQAQIQQLLIQASSDMDKAQASIDTAEASNSSVFVAGWRPFIGWIGGSAMAWVYILQPVIVFFYVLKTGAAPALPPMDLDSLISLILGMLGLTGLHVYENVQTTKNK